jgi:UrcA family protein
MGFEGPFDEVLYSGKFAANTNQGIFMNTSNRFIAIAAIVLAGSAFGPVAAIAADTDGPALLKHVSYSDLDLSREPGARVLYQRIKSAAGVVCAPLSGRQLSQYMNQANCVTNAIETAVKQVNEPMLTRYYLTRNPKSDLDTSLAAKR